MALRMNKRLQKEYEAFQKNTHDMKAVLPKNDLTLWHINFPGAKGTLYEGEQFTVQLRFNNDYVTSSPPSPLSPPRCSSSGTCQFTSTSTPTVSFVSPSSMTVLLLGSRVVAGPHCDLHLPLHPLDDEQRQKENQAIQ